MIETILQAIRPPSVVARTMLRALTQLLVHEGCALITALLAHLCRVDVEQGVFKDCNQGIEALLKRMNIARGEKGRESEVAKDDIISTVQPIQTTGAEHLSITLHRLATGMGIMAKFDIFDSDMRINMEEAEDSLVSLAESIGDGTTPI